MVSFASNSIIVFFVILSCISLGSARWPGLRGTNCNKLSKYTSSHFPTNLNVTLSSLYMKAANATPGPGGNGFFHTSTGQGTDAAYGLILCRGDVSHELCQRCIKTAKDSIVRLCPNHKEAITWYDHCMLRYSNQTMISRPKETPKFRCSSEGIRSYSQKFNESLAGLMYGLVKQAVSGTNNFYATGHVNGTAAFDRIHGLVQCTPDITPSECNICLSKCVASDIPAGCKKDMLSGMVMKPSCSVRYQSFPFRVFKPEATPPPVSLATLVPPPISVKTQISTKTIIATLVPTFILVVLLSIFCYCLRFCRKSSKKYNSVIEDGYEATSVQSLQFELDIIEAATNNFSDDNMIGQGGFGRVYKGTLVNGQKIAVKRLSRSSRQGGDEFRNEVLVLAKLQHRNLVRLFGFCLQEEEKILVYEFVPNKSLDYFLFDPEKHILLNWSISSKIIGSIARGLLYLHEDSRLRIIHRDLKASNILLDKDMVPKISDFGMARIFGMDQTHGSTNKIAGTYGYMSPEYAIHGQFSVKSDVFSFGVLVLEIISGTKITSFYQPDTAENLLSYAWRHWRDGTPLEVMSSVLASSYSRNEVTRCIQIGLLCVQEDPADRPAMATVALMLGSSSFTLPMPQQPAFFVRSRIGSSLLVDEIDSEQSSNKSMPLSLNEASITELHPR